MHIRFIFIQMWAVVETKDNLGRLEVSVVPTNWIVDDVLFWPPVRDVTPLVKKRTEIADMWKTFSFVMLKPGMGKIIYSCMKSHAVFALGVVASA